MKKVNWLSGILSAWILLVIYCLIGLTGCFPRVGVRIGDGFLVKSQFVNEVNVGQVTDIVAGELDPVSGEEIGIAGYNGVVYVDYTGTVINRVSVNPTWSTPNNVDVEGDGTAGKTRASRPGLVNIVDVEGDGTAEYMTRGSWPTDAALIDHQGNELWRYGGSWGVNDMDLGDMDGDGVCEFVVGFNSGGGVHLLDNSGRKVWQKSASNVWHVEFADTNGDGNDEIIHSNVGGDMTVRDSSGNILYYGEPGKEPGTEPGTVYGLYFSSFSLAEHPENPGEECAIQAYDDKIWMFEFDGTTIEILDAPDCGTLGDVYSATATLETGQPEYLAALVNYQDRGKSLFYLYDDQGSLVYYEVLGESCCSIAAVPLGDDGSDVLLVGGRNEVFKYELSD